VDETLEAPLADRCECGGEIVLVEIVEQFQGGSNRATRSLELLHFAT
jgi:hypothetical protein